MKFIVKLMKVTLCAWLIIVAFLALFSLADSFTGQDKHRESEMKKLGAILSLQKVILREAMTSKIPDDMQYVTVSAYNAVRNQTDSTPHITANGKHVKPGTCAISRDLIARGWAPGDLLYVPSLNATFEIADTMAARHEKSIDI